MRFEVRTAHDAKKALEHFNHFHDGYLETLAVRVVSENPFGFGEPLRYQVELQLVHDNFPACTREQQRIALRFRDVVGLRVNDFVPLDAKMQGSTIVVDAEGVLRFDLNGDSDVTFAARSLTIEEVEAPR